MEKKNSVIELISIKEECRNSPAQILTEDTVFLGKYGMENKQVKIIDSWPSKIELFQKLFRAIYLNCYPLCLFAISNSVHIVYQECFF